VFVWLGSQEVSEYRTGQSGVRLTIVDQHEMYLEAMLVLPDNQRLRGPFRVLAATRLLREDEQGRGLGVHRVTRAS
jgi:hypothetical protein